MRGGKRELASAAVARRRESLANRSEGLRCPAPPPRPLPHTTAGRGALFAVLRGPRGEECCFRRLRSLPLRSLVSGLSFRLSLRERASLCALVFSMSLCGLCALRGARGLFVSSLSRARASVAGLAAGRARQCAVPVGGPGWNWGEAGASALTSVRLCSLESHFLSSFTAPYQISRHIKRIGKYTTGPGRRITHSSGPR